MTGNSLSRVVVLTATSVGLVGIVLAPVSAMMMPGGANGAWWSNYVSSISSGLLGTAVSFVAVGLLFENSLRRSDRRLYRSEQARGLVVEARSTYGNSASVVTALRALGLLNDGSLAGCSFSEMDLEGADFDGADLRGCDFSGANLVGASFIGARVDDCRFRNARLEGAIVEFSSAVGADFRDAIL